MRGRCSLLVDPKSLSMTVDAVNEAFFEGRRIPVGERKRASRWIAARHRLPGAYADTFAGFEDETTNGIVVFTGERMTFGSARHILGEEACRALRLLGAEDRRVQAALEGASEGLLRCLERAEMDPRYRNPGVFCCGKCSVALWRHLLAGGLDRPEERLHRGIGYLKRMRDGKGGWRRFPFWYTVLSLVEADSPQATRELRYASPTLRRVAGRAASTTYARRRCELALRALRQL